jgi:hypothetical protein
MGLVCSSSPKMLSMRNLLLVLLQGTVCHPLQDLQKIQRYFVTDAMLSSFMNVSS